MKPQSFSEKSILFKNNYLELYSVVADFSIFTREYFVTKWGTRVGVIIEKDNSILLVKQYRYVVNDYSWELPSGGRHDNESLEEAAVRECIEETGIKCRTIDHIYDFILSADVADSPAHIFYTKDFESIREFDTQEITEIRWVPYNDCIEMVLSKKIKDIFTVIGLLIYILKHKKTGDGK